MAVGIFQLSLVFALGYYIGLAAESAVAAGVNEIPLSLYLKNPDDVIIPRGQEAILKCEAQSSAPGLSVSWLFEGNPVLANDSRVQQLSDGSLYIHKMAGKKLEGKYQCLAKNDIGAVLSNPAQLKIASIGREFSEQPHNISIAEQQPVVLPCRIHSIPDAIIYWECDNKPLPHNTRYVPLPSGALLITSTHSTDTGLYRCVAKNRILKKTKRSKPGHLITLPHPTTITPPKLLPLGLAPNVTTVVGSNITLPCVVTGWPIPTIQWLNNISTVKANSSVLELKNVTTDSTGNYSCIATNSAGQTTMHFSVEVQEAPHFNVTPLSISYPSARTVRLDCQAKGVPEPKITWLKNGVLLEPIGRVKQQQSGLVLSHSFTTDAGLYQCVASNPVGQLWVSAQLIPSFSENRPNPPQNVECRSFDDNSICLIWRSPPNISIQAYSVYVFNEVKGYDFVTNYTYYLTNGLQSNTQYTMYVRSYSKEASDQSDNVSCRTGIQGERNLKVEYLKESSVQLTWSNISNDIPCGSATVLYKVQWKKSGQSSVHVDHTSDFKKIISRLKPSSVYQFRVQSTTNKNDNSPWVTFSLLKEKSSSEVTVTSAYVNEVSSSENETLAVPFTPIQVEAEPLSPYSVNLTWVNLDDHDNLSYNIYCIDVKEGKSRVIESENNYLEVTNLKANTLYEFKVRSQNVKGSFSPFSLSVEVQTQTDVPSSVQNLKYRIINATTACVMWRTPIHMNGRLLNYVISYTSDKTVPLDKWSTVYLQEKDIFLKSCWPLEEDEISIILTDLNSDLQYTLIVRAATEVGLGNSVMPIIFSTFNKKLSTNLKEDSTVLQDEDDINYKQKLGVAVGVSVSALCILCCISCVIFRRRCIKRETVRRAGLSASNNYYSAGMPYSGTSLHMRHQDSCSTEAHEMQQLVMEGGSAHIPPIESTHLDTKGGIGFPNGQLNGTIKHLEMNGHVPNGHINIIENPRYEYHNCNGNLNSNKNEKDSSLSSHKSLDHLQDNGLDSKKEQKNYVKKSDNSLCTSNTSPSNASLPLNTENGKIYKLFDMSDYNSNCNSEMYHTNIRDSYIDLDPENSLNDTQNTYLENSFSALPNRIISPALAPNG